MNNFNCVATCVRDAEVRFSQSGTSILTVKVANNIGFKDKQKTNWITVVMFGKMAESWLNNELKKGVKIVANGVLFNEVVTNSDGTKYFNSTLTVKEFDSIHICANNKADDGARQSNSFQKKPQNNFDDYDNLDAEF